MPNEMGVPGGNGRRNKLVHQQGVVGKVEYISVGDHPYTGMFTGAKHGIIRLSNANLFIDDFTEEISPSIAVKYLRNDQPSANYLGMTSYDSKTGMDFFGAPFFSNHVPKHEDTCSPLSIGRFHSSMTRFIYQNGNHDLATHNELGEVESVVDYPF